jgi:hypothetical protein
MSNSLRALALLGLAGLLSACGTTDIERTATGAAIGAGIATVTDEDVVDGALIGAALGAVSCSVAPGAPNCY